MARKITPKKKADIALMRAADYTKEEIAKEMGVSRQTIHKHLSELRERAEEIGYHQAVVELIMKAGPDYVMRLTPFKMTPREFFEEIEFRFEEGEE